MKTLIGVYASHDGAVKAIESLKISGYPVSQVSLLAKADLKNNQIYLRSGDAIEGAEMGIGAASGAILGLLTGVGVFAIPGFGILYGAGAAMGAFLGAGLGTIGGSFIGVLTGIRDNSITGKYEKHLNDGKYLVFVQGEVAEIKKAEKILGTLGLHMELSLH